MGNRSSEASAQIMSLFSESQELQLRAGTFFSVWEERSVTASFGPIFKQHGARYKPKLIYFRILQLKAPMG